MVSIAEIEKILDTVQDPEIPVLSVVDLGIVNEIEAKADGSYEITIIPTYSGCPAVDAMAEDIVTELEKHGIKATVKQQLDPPWTSDLISEKGRKALEKYGIAAPLEAEMDIAALKGEKNKLKCTNCGSSNTKMISRFGSTACKALFQCEDCHEPFEYFKCLK